MSCRRPSSGGQRSCCSGRPSGRDAAPEGTAAGRPASGTSPVELHAGRLPVADCARCGPSPVFMDIAPDGTETFGCLNCGAAVAEPADGFDQACGERLGALGWKVGAVPVGSPFGGARRTGGGCGCG